MLALARTHAGCEVRVRAGAEHMLPLADAAWVRAQIASLLSAAPVPAIRADSLTAPVT